MVVVVDNLHDTVRRIDNLIDKEEAVAVGVMSALRPEDAVIATYREHGHALALGIDAGRIMAEMYGNVEGVSMGRGDSMHLFDRFFAMMTESDLSAAAGRQSS